LPKLSQFDHYVLDIIKSMKKLPAVKRELNSKPFEKPSQQMGGGDIFDDFFGGGSTKKEDD